MSFYFNSGLRTRLVCAADAHVASLAWAPQETKRIEAERARVQAQLARKQEEERLSKVVRKRVITRFGEQLDTSDKTYAPTIPGGVSSRFGPKKKSTEPQVSRAVVVPLCA